MDRTELLPPSDVRWAIVDVLTTYCALMDQYKFEEMSVRVFADDAVESHGKGFPDVHGRQEIADQFTSLMARFEGAMHNISNTRFQQNEDGTVHTWTYFQGYHWYVETGPDSLRPADLITTGVYQDVFALTTEGWRIRYRERRNVGPSPVGIGQLPSGFAGVGGSAEA